MTCCVRARAFTAARTAEAPPAAAGTASTISPVIDVAQIAAARAAHTCRATSVRASSPAQPVPAARVLSRAHHLATLAETNLGMRAWRGGAATARTPVMTAKPATNAAAVSIIEPVQQTRWIGNLRKLGPDALWHGRRRTAPVPPAVRPESDGLLQHWVSLGGTPGTARRKKLSFPRVIGRASDDGRVQDEVDLIYHLGEDGLRARRLRIAEGKPDKAGQRFTRAVCPQRADPSPAAPVPRGDPVHSLP